MSVLRTREGRGREWDRSQAFHLDIPFVSPRFRILAIPILKIEPGTWRVAAYADTLREPGAASGAEDVGVIGRRAIRDGCGGDFVEIGEFVSDVLHLVDS